jgi:Tol biopolymer transport system component
MIRAVVVWVSIGILLPASALASGRYDPRLQFKTLSTQRFDIHYHQGEEAEARRLASIAEGVAAKLDGTLGRPSGRVQVILVDQTDLSNGWATPLPFNTIEIVAAAPAAKSSLGNTDDWLQLVFSHEYTHIVHLSRGAGWIGGLRRAFGRMPLLYPNLFLPIWQIEGIAVHEESGVTGRGRVPASDFRAILGVAARASRVEPLDRVNGGLIAWPSGQGPYVYGAYFHEFLAKKYGEAALARLTDATAGQLPYFGSLAFKKVFKRSLGDLWNEFESATRSETNALAPSAAANRLTHDGFSVFAPRFTSNGRLYYSTVNPHGFPSLRSLDPDLSRSRKVANRYLGSGMGVSASLLVFDQIEVVNNVGLQSDLYVVSPETGSVRRLTHEARAGDPDITPDGHTLVFTIQRADRRDLATMTLPADRRSRATIETLISEPHVYFASPRWSRDGRSIAAERGRGEIVLIDPTQKRVVETVATAPTGRAVTPSWMPDGSLLFASDRDGAFRIYRIDPRTGQTRRLEGTGPDARAPEVSADGKTLVFVGYTVDGYDLFSLPVDTATWTIADVQTSGSPVSTNVAGGPLPEVVPRPYSSWRTVWPRFWTPIVEVDADEWIVGVATAGNDALGRHAYALQAGWATSRGRPDIQGTYIYDRWWPTLFVNYSDDVDPWRDGDVRTREGNAGVVLPFRRVRWSQGILGALHASEDVFTCTTGCGPDGRVEATRRAVRTGWSLDASRSYGYSISAEDGWSALVTTELSRKALGADGDGGASTVDIRGYLPVRPQHAVIAARFAAARSWGERGVRRLFSASGNEPQPGGFTFGSDAIGLLRGLDTGEIAGTRAAVVNVDYRVPLMRLERGSGTFPLFARTLHGALFADAGHAWESDFRRRDVQVSLGGEISLDAVIGYSLPLTITTGAAWASNGRGLVAFGRVGRAF